MTDWILDGDALDWRETAVDHALQAEELGGDAEYALLRSIRRHRPGAPTIALRLSSSSRYRNFLAECVEDCRGLLSAEH